jgi:hypothetical protein
VPLCHNWPKECISDFTNEGEYYSLQTVMPVGQTCGRSRHDRDHTLQVPVKDIYLYGLCQDFKERLCG